MYGYLQISVHVPDESGQQHTKNLYAWKTVFLSHQTKQKEYQLAFRAGFAGKDADPVA
ncbi:MAG: hypothetical protein MR519_13105 [Spirochaetaceae bacterium]|nr:hypothetical protein [Spirochaetaceae bacterium]